MAKHLKRLPATLTSQARKRGRADKQKENALSRTLAGPKKLKFGCIDADLRDQILVGKTLDEIYLRPCVF